MIHLHEKIKYIIILILLISLLFIIHHSDNGYELFTNSNPELSNYIQSFSQKENRIFPFRYFTDKDNNILPFVAVTGFFRDEDAKNKYYEYINKGIYVFGITAYKSFPNKELLDETEGLYERTDDFDYIGNIKNWLCCFKDKEKYGFNDDNNIIDISESDFYNAETDINTEKKYDFIYICNKDDDKCSLNGWNAFNRNFNLALKCFPIMVKEFKLKGLIVGRVNCGLEEEYGDQLEIVDWLDWHLLQQKMRESRMLFVPNIFDASPRVIAECMTKNLPVLMNINILCGFKYINYETGEFFNDEHDLTNALIKILSRINKISPKKWWDQNYGQEISYKRLKKFLFDSFNDSFNIDQVKFIL